MGIATQNPDLRRLFTGEVEHIVNFFTLMAEELRVIMAQLGVKSVNELVGRTDLLSFNKDKARETVGTLDLSRLLDNPFVENGKTQFNSTSQPDRLTEVLDHQLISLAQSL